jgi:Leucine Rich repeat
LQLAFLIRPLFEALYVRLWQMFGVRDSSVCLASKGVVGTLLGPNVALVTQLCVHVTDAGSLARLQTLSSLILEHCDKLSDDGLKAIAALTSLKKLRISCCNCNRCGIGHTFFEGDVFKVSVICVASGRGLPTCLAIVHLSRGPNCRVTMRHDEEMP